ncbi:MAG: hypothetical protein ACXADC_04595 [Candidatus Thorarchaeota archaeon]
MADDGQEEFEYDPEASLIRCTLSKITFPEVCPVCLEEPEDLVAITILERPLGERGDDRTYSTMKRKSSKADIALEAARGAATLWVPTCLRHGSRSVRSDRMRLISVAGFFILFYPILYFFLAARSSGSPVDTVGFFASIALLILIFLYGYIPRALERNLKVVELEYSKDRVYLRIRNQSYFHRFLSLNEMHCDVVESIVYEN